MPPPVFKTARKLANKVRAYFIYIEGEYPIEIKSGKEEKKYTREPELVTIAGFAFFMGFNSLAELFDYEQNGEFADVISRGCLQVQSVYEKQLHQSCSGAIFALKNSGWEGKDNTSARVIHISNLEISTVETGPKIAMNEAEVLLSAI